MNWRTAGTIVVCGLVSAGAAFMLAGERSREVIEHKQTLEDIRERNRAGESWQSGLSFAPVAERSESELHASLSQNMAGAPGEDLVSDEMKAALTRGIAEQLVARAGGPEAYLAHVDSRPRRWLDPDDDREWFLIECFEQGKVSPTPGDRSNPRANLEQLVTSIYKRSHPRSIATDADASAVVFYNAASMDQYYAEASELLPDDFSDRVYIGYGHNAIRTHWPDITVEELLRRDRRVLCAMAVHVIQAEDESTYAFFSRWTWDPKARRWECQNVSKNGGSRHTMFY